MRVHLVRIVVFSRLFHGQSTLTLRTQRLRILGRTQCIHPAHLLLTHSPHVLLSMFLF